MKILVGGPAREMESEMFQAHKRCLENQENIEVDFFYLEDTGATNHVGREGHRWDPRRVQRVARLRQRFLDTFFYDGGAYDYAAMVDTDLLCGKFTLVRMVRELERVDAQVAYGVFWTDWGQGPQPQVWDVQPYGFRDPKLATRLADGETVRVAGGGACTVFTRAAAECCRYYPLIDSLPRDGTMWFGEDRTFALCCEVHRLRQVAVGDVRIAHLYDERMRTSDKIQYALNTVGQA